MIISKGAVASDGAGRFSPALQPLALGLQGGAWVLVSILLDCYN